MSELRDEYDQMLEGIESLKYRARRVKHDTKKRVSYIREALQGLGIFGRLVLSAARILYPLWLVVRVPIKAIYRSYLRFWNRFAYRTDPKTQVRALSKGRASFITTLTVLILFIFTPTRLGDTIRFATVEPFGDGLLMALTMKTETYYLNSTEEIDPANNVHSVRGCYVEGECGEKDAVYFRVHPRLSHDIWKLVNHGNPVYVPDHVIAPIAPGVNKCAVTYYGYRMTSSWIARLLRSMQFYPTMLEASCIYEGMRWNREK